jgi:DNA-binding CsgD family transcriptional regulator/tetratricopeptide (TPR) repeat protein
MAEARLDPALACLAVGDVQGAVAALEETVAAMPELAGAHVLLGGLFFGALDDYPRARRSFEFAYRLQRESGDLPAAVRCAIALAMVEGAENSEPGRRGWLGRARRLLDEIGPCVEEGYYRVAMMGCEIPDVTELEANAARALELARTFGDTELEIRALAETGLALVSLGRTADGLVLLDEAITAVMSGEVRDFGTCGVTCCAVISACDRLGDLERLTRLIAGLRRMADDHFHGLPQPILTAHCREALGSLLAEAGRWEEAETELQRAIATTACAGHRATATARLAVLCVHRGRVAEAAELLRGWEDRLEVAPALAQLPDARGELELAASTLRWALREQETNLLLSVPLLAHLVDVERRRGDLEAADHAASTLESVAQALGTPGAAAMALLSRGRVSGARGEDPEPALLAALRELRGVERPRLRAEVHLALAEARAADPPAATAEARAALALFVRLGARRDADRAAALLRSLGVTVRAGAGGREVLSRREREVVPLVAEGLSNAEIARRLFVTPKTVEHHVTSILGKLGLRTRAEVAAWAVRHTTA